MLMLMMKRKKLHTISVTSLLSSYWTGLDLHVTNRRGEESKTDEVYPPSFLLLLWEQESINRQGHR